jgi:hypothetical protein
LEPKAKALLIPLRLWKGHDIWDWDMVNWSLEYPPRLVPKLHKQATLQMNSLRHYRNTSQKVMVHHFRIVVVNAIHLQRKVKIRMECIMVMFLSILLVIIIGIIK